jgi:aldehyde:ferredoxin oxidoreductase
MAERRVSELSFNRYWVDLTARSVRLETVSCEDVEDLLGGIGRGFKLLEAHRIEDPYSPDAALVMNLGVLSGTSMMTGLRTYFHAYSPLKRSSSGLPSAMWSCGSGKFGTKLRFLGVDEVIFTGRCESPTTLHITRCQTSGEAEFSFVDATALLGQDTNAKIQALYGEYPDAHFAVIGPAGENYESVLYAAIALSSENQLKSGDAKARYCGRGGMGGVMGSKNLLAIIADVPDQKLEPPAATLKRINGVVGKGAGSARFREAKAGGAGGSWANAEALHPSRSVPEYNFMPTDTDISVPLLRPNVEKSERFEVKAEACFRCGIRCHKNIYEKQGGAFRAKFDYEPLILLSSNIGVFDLDAICELVELADLLGMDAISCGVTVSYAMEYNRRNAESGASVAGGLAYGDAAAARQVIEDIGKGKLPQLGQGSLRLSEELGEPDYAMQSKGMEYPAYIPQTNPGYPWALAGGHMSMRTYMALLMERETGIDYWVEAITSVDRGLSFMRDDMAGICKFSMLPNSDVAEAVASATGVQLSEDDIKGAALRTFLRGYRLEKLQGFARADYQMPAAVHEKSDAIDLPYFNTPEFFAELREKVLDKFDALLESNLPTLPT